MADPAPAQALVRAGVVVDSAPGRCRVRVDDHGCRPCGGRCAAGFRRVPALVSLDRELRRGTRVELVASVSGMAMASALAFGLPLLCLAASLLLVAAAGAAEAWSLAGFAAGALLALALLRHTRAAGGPTVREL